MSEIIQVCWLRSADSAIPFAEIVETGLSNSWETRDINDTFNDNNQCRYTASPRVSTKIGILDTALRDIKTSDYGSIWFKRNGLRFALTKNPFEDQLRDFNVLQVNAPEAALRTRDGTPRNVDSIIAIVRLISNVIGGETYGFGTWGPFQDEDIPSPDELADGHVERLFWLNLFPVLSQPLLPSAIFEDDDLWLVEELGSGGLLVVTCDDPRQRKNANGLSSQEATSRFGFPI